MTQPSRKTSKLPSVMRRPHAHMPTAGQNIQMALAGTTIPLTCQRGVRSKRLGRRDSTAIRSQSVRTHAGEQRAIRSHARIGEYRSEPFAIRDPSWRITAPRRARIGEYRLKAYWKK